MLSTTRIEPRPTAIRTCTRCIMDTSDPDITFDANGVCNHCHIFDRVFADMLSGTARTEALERYVDRIRRAGRGKSYDCVVGLSGGVDSSFLALEAVRMGLRPLVVHLDNGWNTEIAVRNIELILRKLKLDLYTVVLDWEEFRDLQLAFLRASTPDSEIPTDHAILAAVYQTAWKMDIPYLVMGTNRATELVLPRAWSQGHQDWRYIRNVQARFGTRPLRRFPHLNIASYARFRLWNEGRVLNLLEYIDYTRDGAIETLEREVGWRNYGGKHYESIYTRFFQGWILPHKFGFDKRRAHLSNKILAGQSTRHAALAEMRKSPYPSATLAEHDREYVIKKLGITEVDFEGIMRTPPKRYEDYPNMYNSRAFLAVRGAYRLARGGLERAGLLPAAG